MNTKNHGPQQVFSSLSGDTNLAAAAQGFLLSLELENRTPATLIYYRGILSRFQWFAGQYGLPEQLGQLTTNHIRVFLDYVKTNPQRWGKPEHSRARKPTKARTVQRYRAALHAFFNWCVGEEIIEINPVTKIRAPKVEQKMITGLGKTEIKALIDVCRQDTLGNGPRDLAIILVLLDTGIRASELCGLELDDWDKARQLKIWGKGRRERLAPLSTYAAKALWDYVNRARPPSQFEHIFLAGNTARDPGSPLTTSGLAQLLNRRAKQASVRHLNPHLLRHTFALTWVREGGPLHALQTILGHTTPYMSMQYGRMASTDAAELHKQFSPVERLGLRFREKRK